MSAGRGCGRKRKSWSRTVEKEAAVKGRFAATVVSMREGCSGVETVTGSEGERTGGAGASEGDCARAGDADARGGITAREGAGGGGCGGGDDGQGGRVRRQHGRNYLDARKGKRRETNRCGNAGVALRGLGHRGGTGGPALPGTLPPGGGRGQ